VEDFIGPWSARIGNELPAPAECRTARLGATFSLPVFGKQSKKEKAIRVWASYNEVGRRALAREPWLLQRACFARVGFRRLVVFRTTTRWEIELPDLRRTATLSRKTSGKPAGSPSRPAVNIELPEPGMLSELVDLVANTK